MLRENSQASFKNQASVLQGSWLTLSLSLFSSGKTMLWITHVVRCPIISLALLYLRLGSNRKPFLTDWQSGRICSGVWKLYAHLSFSMWMLTAFEDNEIILDLKKLVSTEIFHIPFITYLNFNSFLWLFLFFVTVSSMIPHHTEVSCPLPFIPPPFFTSSPLPPLFILLLLPSFNLCCLVS